MSFDACLAAVRQAAPDLTDKEFEEVASELDRVRRLKMVTGEAASMAEASELAARELGDRARVASVVAERERLLNEAKRLRLRAYAETQFPDNPAEGLEARAVGSAKAREGARRSAMTEQRAVLEEYLGGLNYDLEAAGVYKMFISDAMERDVARALWAIDQPNTRVEASAEAHTIAKIIRKWQEKSRRDMNAEGAWIGKLDDYITRQSHDSTLLRKAAGKEVIANDPAHFEAWRDFIRPLLDEQRTPITDNYLREVYVGLVTGDHLKAGSDAPSGFVGPRNLAKKLSGSRSLHFKDADSWLVYNDRFGTGKVSQAVVNSLDLAAQSVGLMRTFGTNPRAVLHQAIDEIATGLRGNEGALKALNDSRAKLDRMMSHLDGTTRIPENEMWAEVSTGIRTLQNTMKLPLMLLSQFSDLVTFASEMKFVHGQGYLSGLTDAITGIGKTMANPERRKLMSQIGVFSDGMIGDLATKFGAVDTPRGKVSDLQQKFFKLIGARWWNTTMRRRAAEVTSHNLALTKDIAFDALPKDLSRALGLYEIKAGEWDAIRGNVRSYEGREFLVPEGLDEGVSRKFRAFIADRVDYAALTPDAKTNYYMLWGTDLKRGTAAGEAIRFVMQFKGFPVAFTQRVLGREIYGRGANTLGEALTGKNGELVGLAQMMFWMTAMGYVSVTAKELAKGKQPRDVSDPAVAWRTMLAAGAQSGGLGIYADFLFGEANRGGGGTASTFLGPTLSDVSTVNDMFKRLVRGEDVKAEAFRLGLKTAAGFNPYTAAIVNGYPRIALDYLFLYRLQEEMSPGYLRRMEQRIQKENAQQYVFPPTSYAK